MGKAFQCDVCGFLEHGVPVAKHSMTGTDQDRPAMKTEEEWCSDCLADFIDWKASRVPDLDEVDESEDAGDDEEHACPPFAYHNRDPKTGVCSNCGNTVPAIDGAVE